MFDGCLYFNANSLSRTLDRIWTEAFSPFRLTPSQGFLLRTVLAKPGQSVNALAHGMNIAKPTATRALNHLEDAGLIRRKSSPEDGREMRIVPTPKAIAIHENLNRASGQVTKALKDLLGEKKFADAVAEIRSIDQQIREIGIQ